MSLDSVNTFGGKMVISAKGWDDTFFFFFFAHIQGNFLDACSTPTKNGEEITPLCTWWEPENYFLVSTRVPGIG